MRWDKRRRLLLRWALASVVILLAITTWSLSQRPAEQAVLPGVRVEGLTSVLTRQPPEDAVPIRFEDVTADLQVAFEHFPAVRASLLPEDMGSGVACGDYDGDGWPDLFFVNFRGSIVPGSQIDDRRGAARLYRNARGQRFEDVTGKAGIRFVGFGMGACWGDFDNDEDLDLYVTSFGPNFMYENLGDGTFRDVTAQVRLQDDRFSAGCSWGDYDRDGHLDLYVCNYVDFEYRDTDRAAVKLQYATEQPYTLNPSSYAAQPNALFHNRGDGTFEELAERVGVADPRGRSLSASWVDFDLDDWPDLYVANDVSNNGVFHNRRGARFEDIGAGSLAADYRGAMGIAVADIDDDLDEDLFITHWIAQENALYVNMTFDAALTKRGRDSLWFMDEAEALGLGQSSLDMVGWATGFVDFDNDGRRDIWLVNGSTLERVQDHRLLEPQAPAVLWNRGVGGFVNVSERALGERAAPAVGRGGAHLDFDRDGRVDWVILVHGSPAVVLKNVSEPTGHWLRVRLRQTGGNTTALGARVYATAAGRTWMAVSGSGSSYLSQNEMTLHFGLGSAHSVDRLRIVWPDGGEQIHEKLDADQELQFTHHSAYPVR